MGTPRVPVVAPSTPPYPVVEPPQPVATAVPPQPPSSARPLSRSASSVHVEVEIVDSSARFGGSACCPVGHSSSMCEPPPLRAVQSCVTLTPSAGAPQVADTFDDLSF